MDTIKKFVKIYSGQPVFDSDITITTWQSFSKAPKNVMEKFEVVFGDEAHLSKQMSSKESSKK